MPKTIVKITRHLVSSTETEHEMQSRLLLNVVVGEGSSILELLTSEDKTLLIGWDSLLVLDLGLDVVNGVRWLNLECDGFASESLDENLHVDWFGC